jgi:transcriptional regulator GlxA family with amidase domain
MEETAGKAGRNRTGDGAPFRVAFFVVPGYSMLALSAAVEPLRSANRQMAERCYEWRIVALEPGRIAAGNGIEVAAGEGVSEAAAADLTVVIASLDVEEYREARLFAWLRRLQAQDRMLGAVSNGALLLARAGVLGRRRATIHWEMRARLAEEFPDLDVCGDLYCWDRGVMTAAGGTAALDMMLALIDRRQGRTVAADVAEQFLHGPMRQSTCVQRQDVAWRYQVTDPRLVAAIRLMERCLSEPLRIGRIAEMVGISERQLERQFQLKFAQSPSDFYMGVRLKAARERLVSSTDSLDRIAEQAGFSSPGHFSRSFKAWSGESPSVIRKRGAKVRVGSVQELGEPR